MSADGVPTSFRCPISHEIMRDPVIDKDGNTYDRTAITQWLALHHTSPLTRCPMSSSDLAPNRSLRDAIEEWLQRGCTTSSSAAAAAAVVLTGGSGDAQSSLPAPGEGSPAPERRSDASEPAIMVAATHDVESGAVLVRIDPPCFPSEARGAPAIDAVCVVDVSGSMGESAVVQNDKGEREVHGLSVLDVVKHAVRTIARLLAAHDRLAIVVFSNEAKVVLPFTAMGGAGVAEVDRALDAMEPIARTNLYDGLIQGMNLLSARQGAAAGRNAAILLLTDGQPNINPPRGIIPTFRRHMERLAENAPRCTINTFGFGYDLDSQLLIDLAREGCGAFVFIPDSGLVGTVFVNSMANLQSICATDIVVTVHVDGQKIASCGAHLERTADGASGKLGLLQFGQPRHLVFRVAPCASARGQGTGEESGASGVPISITVELHDGVQRRELQTRAVPLGTEGSDQRSLLSAHIARGAFIERLADVGKLRNSVAALRDLAAWIANTAGGVPLADALLADLEGEVTLAVQDLHAFERWGVHFVPSLVRANFLEQCNNFKDKSVQHYGGSFFRTLRDKGEEIFLSIPPAVAARQPVAALSSRTCGGAAGGAPPPCSVNIRAYYNASGGCISADSLVAAADGVALRAADVRRGQVLCDGAVVRCVVKIRVGDDLMLPVVHVPGGLVITEYHPIVGPDGFWVFPIDLPRGKSVTEHHEFVYNFVLESSESKTLLINGVVVASLGHGIADNDIIGHEYFGTASVVADLRRLRGFNTAEGLVEVATFLRDPLSKRVCGLLGEEVESCIP